MAILTSNRDMIAEAAEHLARHDEHGYSQPHRAGSGGVEWLQHSDGTWYALHTGDYDCSEMVRSCVAAAGLIDWDYWSSYMWTGNEDAVLRGAGFERVPLDSLERGDVLWMDGHTGVYLGAGLMADAHGDEYGDIWGPSVGDQTGREIEIRSVWSCGWTRAYRAPEDDMTDEQIAKLADVLTHRVWEYIWTGDNHFPAMPHGLTHNPYNLLRTMPELVAEYTWAGDETEMDDDLSRNVYDKPRQILRDVRELAEKIDELNDKLDGLIEAVEAMG